MPCTTALVPSDDTHHAHDARSPRAPRLLHQTEHTSSNKPGPQLAGSQLTGAPLSSSPAAQRHPLTLGPAPCNLHPASSVPAVRYDPRLSYLQPTVHPLRSALCGPAALHALQTRPCLSAARRLHTLLPPRLPSAVQRSSISSLNPTRPDRARSHFRQPACCLPAWTDIIFS